jgi:hypothetical protein
MVGVVDAVGVELGVIDGVFVGVRVFEGVGVCDGVGVKLGVLDGVCEGVDEALGALQEEEPDAAV